MPIAGIILTVLGLIGLIGSAGGNLAGMLAALVDPSLLHATATS